MDVNELLVWMVYLFCLMTSLRTARASIANNLGWLVVCGFILIATITMTYLTPAIAGYTGMSLWLIFFGIPSMLITHVNQLVDWGQYDRAQRLARWLCYLHPADGWEQQPLLISALQLAQQGKDDAAQALLSRYQANNPLLGLNLQALRYWISTDWEAALTWFKQDIPEPVIFQDINLTVYYLRALGETGHLNDLLQALAKAEQTFRAVRDRPKLRLMQVIVLTFCAQPKLVQALFHYHLPQYPRSSQQFWHATAQLAQGQTTPAQQQARQQLLHLRQHRDHLLSQAAERRLSVPLRSPNQTLSFASQQQLKTLTSNLHQEIADRRSMNFDQTKNTVTYSLIAINLLFFVRELSLGGSENIQILEYLGGLNPARVWAGEWWRLLSANFLHFGWLHLSTNMIGLYFLGPFVEANLGAMFYLSTYLMSGVGSMSIFTLLALQSNDGPQILIGASASIMGIVGATGAIFLRSWRQQRSRLAAERLQLIMMIIILQFTFDLLIPRVSFLSHFWGVVLGFLIASLLLLFPSPKRVRH